MIGPTRTEEVDADPWNCSDESKSKAEALLAIWFYARHVPAGFAQYIEPVWTLTIGSLNIVFPCEVKKVGNFVAHICPELTYRRLSSML